MPKVTDGSFHQNGSNTADGISQCDWEELYRFIYSKVQNREEAEDITQEMFAKALSYLKRNDIVIMEYGNYLRAIAINIIRDRWRVKKRARIINIEEVSPEVMATDDFAPAADDRTLIRKAMENLTKEQQRVIDLRIIKGYSSAETARMMMKKEGTIRVLQFRAVKALAKLLNSMDG